MIYFVSNGKGAIKIGITTNLNARMRQLRTSNAGFLSLIGSIKGDARTEKSIHADLKHRRLSGEWFADCSETMAVIQRYIRSGVPSINAVMPEAYERPDFGELSPVKVEIDPYRLQRLEATLAAVTEERKQKERTLAANQFANRVVESTPRTESSGAAAPDAGRNAKSSQISDVTG